MKKFYIDTETTGVDAKKNGLIQLSAVAVIDGIRKATFDEMIQPFPTDEIEQSALDVNHVTKEELFQARDMFTRRERQTPDTAFKMFANWMGRFVNKFDRTDKAFFVGYRVEFDANFVREFFSKNGDTYFGSWFWVPPLDVMGLAAYLLTRERHRLENFKLRTVYEYLHPETKGQFTDEQWHNSLFDIDRTIDIETKLRLKVTKTPQPQPIQPTK